MTLNSSVTNSNQFIKSLQNNLKFLSELIAVMPGHVYWLDRNNVYQGCNNLQAQSVSLNSRVDIVGMKNSDLIWRETASELDSNNLEVMNSGSSIVVEETGETINGKLTFLSQKFPLHNDYNEVVGIFGISFDVTERKLQEQKNQLDLNKPVSLPKIENNNVYLLTAKEIECLYWARQGKTAEETALILGRAGVTIKSYLKSVCRKMNVDSLAQAVVEAVNGNYFK